MQVVYRFRCHECPAVVEAPSREQMPLSCPLCGTEREDLDMSAVIQRGEKPWRPAEQMPDRRH